MFCENINQVHLQELGLTQIHAYHANDTTFEREPRALTITWPRPWAYV